MQSSPEKPLSRRDLLILAAAIILSLAVYLGACAISYRVGFPLDDSWIHQTYARNLAQRGEWSFLPGQPSAGSTAPLWTALLSLGFLLHLSPYIWTFFIGSLFLFGISLQAELIVRRMVPAYNPHLPWAGLLFVLEWHMAWAAFSGMETILHIFIILLVMNILLTGSRNYLAAGMLVGLSIWVRPDGLTLLGPLGLIAVLSGSNHTVRLKTLLLLVLGFGIFFLPYLLFNLVISNTPMPNTFYAKQAEYASWQALPLAERLLFWSLQFFQGLGFVLIPGFVQKVISAVRQRDWGVLLAAIWTAGYILLYLLRLPVYQHGRYFMPAMAVFLLLGFSGFLQTMAILRAPRLRLARQVSIVILSVILMISCAFGVYTYMQDVDYIESQMVDTAIWVANNLPPDALVAAHDIGALGYFDRHPLVDLAGLISPDVILFITDEQRLADYMDARKVGYLVAFSGWRPALTARGTQIFNADSEHNNARSGLGSMAVYRWQLP
jgi:hypothetical protein